MPVASEALKTNGHHQELDTASGVSRLGRQDMPSDSQDQPVTHKEIVGWFGYMRPAVAALVVAAGIGGYIIHGLLAGGWINKPVQENHLNEIVASQNSRLSEIVAAQDKVNTVFFTRFDAMAASIVTTQNQLSGVLAVVQSQGQSLARIEGYMVRSQENLVPAPAMQPPRAHPRPRSQSMNGKPTQQSSLIDRLLR
jgi:hypothetical protein